MHSWNKCNGSGQSSRLLINYFRANRFEWCHDLRCIDVANWNCGKRMGKGDGGRDTGAGSARWGHVIQSPSRPGSKQSGQWAKQQGPCTPSGMDPFCGDFGGTTHRGGSCSVVAPVGTPPPIWVPHVVRPKEPCWVMNDKGKGDFGGIKKDPSLNGSQWSPRAGA